MKTEPIISLAKQLITIPSISGDKKRAVEIIEFVKTQLPDYYVTPFVKEGIPSLLYSNQPEVKKFRIILNAHLDVVPGGSVQFAPVVRDGKLYGRGAYDMKTAAAVNILLFKELADKLPYPIGLQLTTDEETGGLHGTAYQVKQGISCDFMVTAECGSNFDIVYEAKGMLQLKLIAAGKTSHSAYPWVGDNAIMKMYEAIDAINKQFPESTGESYQTTVNVTHISTRNSSKHTVTPDHCEALFDIRYIPGEKKTILKKLESLLPEGVTMEAPLHIPPHETSKDNKYIKKLQKAGIAVLAKELALKKQHATSDARHYTAADCDAVEFGPVGSGQHHGNEWVDIKSIGTYCAILKSFLHSL